MMRTNSKMKKFIANSSSWGLIFIILLEVIVLFLIIFLV